MGCCQSRPKDIEPNFKGVPQRPENGVDGSAARGAEVATNPAFAPVTLRRKSAPTDPKLAAGYLHVGEAKPSDGKNRGAVQISGPVRREGDGSPRQKDGSAVVDSGRNATAAASGTIKHETFARPTRSRQTPASAIASPEPASDGKNTRVVRTLSMASNQYGFDAESKRSSLFLSGGISLQDESSDGAAEMPKGFGDIDVDDYETELDADAFDEDDSVAVSPLSQNATRVPHRDAAGALTAVEEAARLEREEAERKEAERKAAKTKRVAEEAAARVAAEKATQQCGHDAENEAAAAAASGRTVSEGTAADGDGAIGVEVELCEGFEDEDPDALYGPLGDSSSTGRIVASGVIDGEPMITVATAADSKYTYRERSLRRVRKRAGCMCRRVVCVCGGAEKAEPTEAKHRADVPATVVTLAEQSEGEAISEPARRRSSMEAARAILEARVAAEAETNVAPPPADIGGGARVQRRASMDAAKMALEARIATDDAAAEATSKTAQKKAEEAERANWWAEEQKRRAAASMNEPQESKPSAAQVDETKQAKLEEAAATRAEASARERAECDKNASPAAAVSPTPINEDQASRRRSMEDARAALEARIANAGSPRPTKPQSDGLDTAAAARRRSMDEARARLEARTAADGAESMTPRPLSAPECGRTSSVPDSCPGAPVGKTQKEERVVAVTNTAFVEPPAAPVILVDEVAKQKTGESSAGGYLPVVAISEEPTDIPPPVEVAPEAGQTVTRRRGLSFFRKRGPGSPSTKRRSFFRKNKGDSKASKSPLNSDVMMVAGAGGTATGGAVHSQSSGGMAAVVNAKSAGKAWKNTKMQTVAEILAGGDDDAEWEELDPRAIDAAKWTDKEIGRVIDQIKILGAAGPDGIYEVTFGRMFVETAQIFDALSGILKTSKKYGVVEYEGEQLWQGRDDGTVIRLLKEQHDGIKIKRRRKKDLKSAPKNAKTSGFGHSFEQGAKCTVCSKTIYQAEWVGAGGKSFHKSCFLCGGCKKKLSQADYFVSFDRKFRCKKCHNEFERTGM